MCADTVTQPTFLLSELRYTIGQIHVQLGNLLPQSGEETQADGVLDALIGREREYQQRYARILGHDAQPAENGDDRESTFDNLRVQTIALLETAGDQWPQQLIETVQQHVSDDRSCATEIAEQRKQEFDRDSRPDLRQPLTEA